MPTSRFYTLVLASLLSVMFISWALLDGLSLKEKARQHWQGTLAETATADAGQVEAWLASTNNQAQRLAADPRVRHFLASDSTAAQATEVAAQAQQALVEYSLLFGAKFLYLFRADSSLALTLEGAPALAHDTLTAMTTSFAAGLPVYQPIIRGAHTSYLGTAVVVRPQNGVPLGVVMAVYPLSDLLERLGTPAANDHGATRYILRIDHQGRAQAMHWPAHTLPTPAVPASETAAVWPGDASTLAAPFPPKPPYIDRDSSPVYAWRSPPLADGHWATLVTAPPALIYQDIPRQLMWLALRTLVSVALVWVASLGLLWGGRHHVFDKAWRKALQPAQSLFKTWRQKLKKPRRPPARDAILAAEDEDDMFGHAVAYTPPPPLRLVEWPDNAPPTPERMAHFVRDSLQHERIRLHYQPIVDLVTDKPVMFETLLRLADDRNRMVLPPDFLPAARQFDLLKDIDDNVLMASIRKHTQLQQHGKMITLSINLTETAFRNENFMHQFMEGVTAKSINPAYLIFEVSSGALLQDGTAMTFIREMQSMGCRFAIDYFGGGTKAVAATHTLKFDYMKINALRFADVDVNPDTLKTFKDVIDAAQSTRLNIIVEKVETQLMYRLCKKLGVRYAQGFFIAAPAPKFNLF